MRFRAVVLAAGLGRRLRPLTEFVPKPMLPVAGRTVAALTLRQLAEAGCEAVALNLHHQGEQIRRHFGGAFEGMSITYSEEETLLGTLGALAPLADFLAAAELALVINGDSLCRWPIRSLIRRHLRGSAAATLMLSSRAAPELFNAVGVDLEGHLISFGGDREFGELDRKRVFAGAHVFSPELVAGLEPVPADFVPDLYLPLLERGERLRAYESARRWHDLGTPGRYLAAARDWARRAKSGSRPGRGAWVAPGGWADPEARLRRSVVERDARVERGAVVEDSLVMPGAQVAAGAGVRGSIVGPEVRIPAGAQIEHRLVTLERADVQPGEEDSVVGGLVYGPIERS